MKFNRRFIFGRFFLPAFLLLSFAASGFAQTSISEISAQQSALVTEFDVNGLKVLFKRRANSPTVATGLFIRGGARNLTAQNAGIENFMLNVMTEGSKNFPREVLRRELAQTATTIGAGSNLDFSVLSFSSTKQNFDRSWNAFTDIALNPTFAPADIELTRSKILTGLRNLTDDADNYLQILEDKNLYVNHPYQNDPTGTPETISKIQAADFRAFHQNVMQTSKLLLVVVGDLNPADLQKKVAAAFGKLPRGNYQPVPIPTLDFSKSTLDITARPLPTNYVQGAFSAPSLNNPDYFAMRVATTILRENIFEEVRAKRNLSYAPNADMENYAANIGTIYVTAVDANQAVSVMLDEINKIKTRIVNPRVISSVVGQFVTNYYLGQETNAAQAAELARYELLGGGWRNAFNFLSEAQKVTPQDVQRVSQQYIKNIRFTVLGKPEAIDRKIFIGQN